MDNIIMILGSAIIISAGVGFGIAWGLSKATILHKTEINNYEDKSIGIVVDDKNTSTKNLSHCVVTMNKNLDKKWKVVKKEIK